MKAVVVPVTAFEQNYILFRLPKRVCTTMMNCFGCNGGRRLLATVKVREGLLVRNLGVRSSLVDYEGFSSRNKVAPNIALGRRIKQYRVVPKSLAF